MPPTPLRLKDRMGPSFRWGDIEDQGFAIAKQAE
jgi:hypothetical protein